MIHTYTGKKGTRYRYYICQKATKQGAKSCPTGSLPASEIEKFVIERITTIGGDPALVRSIVGKVATMTEEKRAVLDAEKDHIERSLRSQAKLVAAVVGQPNAASRLADLEDQIRAGEHRLAEISKELEALDRIKVSIGDVVGSLTGFRAYFERLTKDEATETLSALVEQVIYDREKGTISLSFHPSGIKSLAETIQP